MTTCRRMLLGEFGLGLLDLSLILHSGGWYVCNG